MYRIATGVGVVTGIAGGAFWYQRYPHNGTAITLAKNAIEMAKPHLECTHKELREIERLYGKEIEKLISGTELKDSGYSVDLTKSVWSAVMPNGRPGCFRVITGVDEKCVQIKEVHINP